MNPTFAAPVPLRAPAGLLAFLLLTACGGDGTSATPEPIVEDSAGIEIVRYGGGLPAEPVWRADTDRLLELPGEFFQVRGATELSNGTIVVADGGSRRLALYGPDGESAGTIGGEGEGPGEFRQISSMHRWPGDSLLVFDLTLRRLTLFGPEGDLARTFAFEVRDDVPFGNLQGVHADGSMAATGFSQLPDGGPADGLQRYPSPVYAFHPDGSVRGVTGVETWGESWFQAFGDGGFRVTTVPFARRQALVVTADHLVSVSTGTGELRIHRPSGELVRIVRGLGADRPVTAAARRAELRRILDGATAGIDEEEYRRELEGITRPERLPALQRAVADREGLLWIEPYRDPETDSEAPWTIHGTDGGFVAHAHLPSRFSPLEIGPTHVLGILTDDFDVERVVRIPLDR